MAKQAEENGRVTKRVVLRRERVLVMPPEADAEAIKTALKEAKLPTWFKTALAEAWVVVGEFDGASKTKAIETHAGKPGTPDAKPGAYKAPSVSSWAGGEEYVRPDAPKVERKALD